MKAFPTLNSPAQLLIIFTSVYCFHCKPQSKNKGHPTEGKFCVKHVSHEIFQKLHISLTNLTEPSNQKPSQTTFGHNSTPVLNFRAIEIETETENYLYWVWVSGLITAESMVNACLAMVGNVDRCRNLEPTFNQASFGFGAWLEEVGSSDIWWQMDHREQSASGLSWA